MRLYEFINPHNLLSFLVKEKSQDFYFCKKIGQCHFHSRLVLKYKYFYVEQYLTLLSKMKKTLET